MDRAFGLDVFWMIQGIIGKGFIPSIEKGLSEDMERIPYWLIKGGIVIDFLAIPAMALFCYGIYLHWQRISKGEARLRFSWETVKPILARRPLTNFVWNGLLGARLYRKPITGLFHGLVFWGMLLLLIGTTLVLLNVLLDLPVMSGIFYHWFMAFGLDLAGVAIVVGLAFLCIRRLMQYPRLSIPKQRNGFVAVECLLLAVILTGFVLEGFRINISGGTDNAFVGAAIAKLVGSSDGNQATYTLLWWFHGLLALGFVAYIPYSPMAHLLFIPVNAALAEPIIGADEKALDLPDLDEEPGDNPEAELPALGTPTLADYSSKRLFDFSTCLWCGRCQEVCPAAQTEKRLTPKGVMITLAERLQRDRMTDGDLIDTVGMETLFECRTCGACVVTCPAMTNPLKTIWSMRQNLMMERGEMPSHMLSAYRNMEALMHPFSSSISPSDWRKGLAVPQFKANETEYLLWIGCAVTYEDRAQQVGRAMVRILNAAGVSYGILEEARCTGDPAKQLGDDYLFSMLANANIELFASYGVQKIITMCPHCYNSFTKYYSPLGGHYDVIPHAVLLKTLMSDGQLKPGFSNQKIAYHDPCYMGRHNNLFEAPRDVVSRVGKLSELPRNQLNSFCCGAGGGNYWNEEEGQRISYLRAKEAFDSGAEKLASSCPFCLLMLTDGMKMYTDKKVVFDIAEVVAQNLEDESIKE